MRHVCCCLGRLTVVLFAEVRGLSPRGQGKFLVAKGFSHEEHDQIDAARLERVLDTVCSIYIPRLEANSIVPKSYWIHSDRLLNAALAPASRQL